MYICICQQITDTDIKQALCNGAACSLKDLSDQLGIARCCGQCSPEAKRIVEEHLSNTDSSSLSQP